MLRRALCIILVLTLSGFSQMRVVSLGPSITRTMTALGVDEYLVGHTQFCDVAPNSQSTTIGSMLEINIEAILALGPDHIFAVGLTPVKVLDKLRQFGLIVSIVDDPASFEMLCQNMRDIARVCGVVERGDSLIDDAQSRIVKVREKYATDTPLSCMIQLVANPPYVVLDSTLGGELIEIVGTKNAFGHLKNGYTSREVVLATNPDVIILPDMDGGALVEIEKWKTFTNLSAVQRDAVFLFSSSGIGSPSVPLFAETVEQLAEKIYGK